jgi:hypothetical protein
MSPKIKSSNFSKSARQHNCRWQHVAREPRAELVWSRRYTKDVFHFTIINISSSSPGKWLLSLSILQYKMARIWEKWNNTPLGNWNGLIVHKEREKEGTKERWKEGRKGSAGKEGKAKTESISDGTNAKIITHLAHSKTKWHVHVQLRNTNLIAKINADTPRPRCVRWKRPLPRRHRRDHVTKILHAFLVLEETEPSCPCVCLADEQLGDATYRQGSHNSTKIPVILQLC